MSLSKLPSGRWRAQVYDPGTGRNVSVSKILGPAYASFASKRDAKAAREKAREALAGRRADITVTDFRDRWLNDPLFARPKRSTMIHNQERTQAFTDRYGSLPMRLVTDEVVAEWLAAGNAGTVPSLKAMWNDAMSVKAGRATDSNPWVGVKLPSKRGRRRDQVPPEDKVKEAITAAHKIGGAYFAAWLQVAAYTGMRPGELDALRWPCIDYDTGRILVREQWSPKTQAFTTPKNGQIRKAPLTPPARAALLKLPADHEFCFVNLRGQHFTPSSRAYAWKAVKAAIDWDGPLYLATRHWAGSYMINELGLSPEDVAISLGHTDGGYLVRTLYGHLDEEKALDRVTQAYERAAGGNVTSLRAVDGGAS